MPIDAKHDFCDFFSSGVAVEQGDNQKSECRANSAP
jgi:hypothetical protein